MPMGRTRLIAVLTAAVGVLVAGCGDAENGNGRPPTDAAPTSSPDNSPTAGRTGAARSGTSNPIPSAADNQEDRMRIQITIGDQRFHATLSDSAAARDLVAQLPVTIDMVDHGAVEKTGGLPSSLSLDGQPAGADPDVGDVGYYAPGNDLVFYYGDQSYYQGIVILGRLEGNAAERIADFDGPVTATVETNVD
jgi:hypothetical protein